MQLIQPKVKELQKKYGHDRERLAQETMKLYKETGTNPFASCLPILVQMPIFLALFRLIDQAAKHGEAERVLTDAQTSSRQTRPSSARRSPTPFMTADGDQRADPRGGPGRRDDATTFLTQRQLMSKNMPADALTGQYAQQQKMLLYVLPVVFAVGGIAFPIGVLLYWTTSNLWTMGQQFYVIRNNPAPGHAGRQGQAGPRRREAEAQGTAGRGGPPPTAGGHEEGGAEPPAEAPAAQEADPQPAQEADAAGRQVPAQAPRGPDDGVR